MDHNFLHPLDALWHSPLLHQAEHPHHLFALLLHRRRHTEGEECEKVRPPGLHQRNLPLDGCLPLCPWWRVQERSVCRQNDIRLQPHFKLRPHLVQQHLLRLHPSMRRRLRLVLGGDEENRSAQRRRPEREGLHLHKLLRVQGGEGGGQDVHRGGHGQVGREAIPHLSRGLRHVRAQLRHAVPAVRLQPRQGHRAHVPQRLQPLAI
mmetsp:Transcript_14462/g.26718  ORF Transcript_14462/g.26718 Transcript_14462/m.26718 type:complete len:206 (+) Transcript_14462:431-1048(+)